MTKYPEIFVLRHGQTEWNLIGRFQGRKDSPLTKAQIALDQINLKADEDDRLCEVGFGAWEGLTLAEIEQNSPEMDHEGDPFMWNFYAPGGENFEELEARCRSFLDHLTRSSVIVTHGITSRVLRGVWLGQGPEDMRDMLGGQGNVHHLSDGKQTQLQL